MKYLSCLVISLTLFAVGASARPSDDTGVRADTSLHFYFSDMGGSVVVEVKDPDNFSACESLRNHLEQLTQMFEDGRIGTRSIKKLRNAIRFSFQETPAGGRIVIESYDRYTVAAIHTFLEHEIETNKTGDSIMLRDSR